MYKQAVTCSTTCYCRKKNSRNFNVHYDL